MSAGNHARGAVVVRIVVWAALFAVVAVLYGSVNNAMLLVVLVAVVVALEFFAFRPLLRRGGIDARSRM
jgi:uncharacterized membrane-anchored protein